MARYLTMSISMAPEMADMIDEEAEKHGMNASEYVRQVLREHEGTPFENTRTTLALDENSENRRNEGAA